MRETGARPGDRGEPAVLGFRRLAPLPFRGSAGRHEGEPDEGERRGRSTGEDEPGECGVLPERGRGPEPQPDRR